METKKYCEKIETILEQFPLECRKNYDINILDVVIEHKEGKMISGSYAHDLNIITLYNDESLSHELFHMSFRDRSKINQKLYDDAPFYYDNGIAFYKYIDGKKILYGHGLTEGFAEYLSRKCNSSEGQIYNYYFASLLVDIYGEDILQYPLKNDPIGFIYDERFYNISDLIISMDSFNEHIKFIKLITYLSKETHQIFRDNEKLSKEMIDSIENTEIQLKTSLINNFIAIINEYNNCPNPLINRGIFINKLKLFINSEYNNIFKLDDGKINAKNKIKKIIKRETKKRLF